MTTHVRVLVPPLAQYFTYELPEALSQVEVGFRVLVPFGKRKAYGYVIGKDNASHASPEYTVKQVAGVDGNYPHFNPSQTEFFKWVAEYYGDTLSRVLEVAVPPSVPQKFERAIIRTKLSAEGKNLGTLQRGILETLENGKGLVAYSDILRKYRGAGAALKKLTAYGLIEVTSDEILNTHIVKEIALWAKSAVALNENQARACELILSAAQEDRFEPFLLHGVTGSGKTEVYIEVAKQCRAHNKGALIIVPEIALTPQLIDRFRARLGENIAILHSALHKRARWDSWRALVEGRCTIAIGARSGIFAPIPNLGVIFVDEEHDSSYKQSEGLRYHARDLALVRGSQEKCPVVLGSATPSLETYYNAMRSKYTFLRLPASHSTAAASSIEIVDLNQIKPWEMRTRNISPQLFEALSSTIARDEQTFILYNRRGFASYLQCDRCEHVLECPNCSVTLTLHQNSNSLLCHYCNFQIFPPKYCPKCEGGAPASEAAGARAKKKKGSDDPKGEFVQRGAGTERIFEELKELFPNVGIDRLDRDTALNTELYKKILDKVRSGETKILVGTQMIAKGHDLPGVTLVGIADCDVGLHMPDFRASERIFNLLTQAAGRAGRGDKAGRVILQTRVPEHPSLTLTVTKDYEAFARGELRSRKTLGYPPYSKILRVVVSSPMQSYPQEILLSFREHAEALLRKEPMELSILGPSPTPLERLKGEWRWHLLFKSPTIKPVHRVLTLLQGLKIKTGKVKIIFDLDPQEMM